MADPGLKRRPNSHPCLAFASCFLRLVQQRGGEVSNLEVVSLLFLTALAPGTCPGDSPVKRARAQGPPHLLGYSFSEAACPQATSGGAVWDQKPASLGLPPPDPHPGQSPPARAWEWAPRGAAQPRAKREPSRGRLGKGPPGPGDLAISAGTLISQVPVHPSLRMRRPFSISAYSPLPNAATFHPGRIP